MSKYWYYILRISTKRPAQPDIENIEKQQLQTKVNM